MVVTGGCLCKAVRYEIAAEPIAARTCWCRLCQYIGAGSATVNAAFQKSAITISGEVRDYRSVADSGSVMHRSFCPTCGTHLFSEAEPRPHLIFVRAGTLDDPEIARPLATIWAAEAPSWACFDESIPRIEGQPPPAG
ncbi:MAG TPA: GFA family protein [Roseiarcus sp.]|jgi:hypothetical protein